MRHILVCNNEENIVKTDKGAVRGFSLDGLHIFKGIPYARAKRFHAPEPAEAWDGLFDATSFGYVCPLFRLPKPNGELDVPHRYWPMDEDCLNLNIWTPGIDDKKRPVLVWLHGGAFSDGSAIEHVAYEGENMARFGDVVMVSVNHRLNILGYLDLSDFGEEYANSGNAGTDDIIAALKWIQINIAAFGGDPDCVTVFGQSGGGAKVTTLLQSPAADGLYHRGMNMSGVVGPDLADSEGSGGPLIRAMMKEIGTEDVRILESVPYQQLVAAYEKCAPAIRAAGGNVGTTPHPNAYYAGSPDKHGFRKETAHIPMLIGNVFGEFSAAMAPEMNRAAIPEAEQMALIVDTVGEEAANILIPLFKEAYPTRRLVDILSLDCQFREPSMDYIRQRCALNNSTYSYMFLRDMAAHYGKIPVHCVDIPFYFHNTELVPSSCVEGSEKLEAQMFGALMAFARTGNPNHAGIPEWPASTPEEEKVIIWDREVSIVINHDHKLMPEFVKYMGPVFMKRFLENREQLAH